MFCLCLWLVFELLCFLILPLLGAITLGDGAGNWFALSVFFGVGGSLLFAISSEISLDAFRRQKRFNRFLQFFAALPFSWVGLAGVAFPLFTISLRIFKLMIERYLTT